MAVVAEQVVTDLTIDATTAAAGSAEYVQAMARAAAAQDVAMAKIDAMRERQMLLAGAVDVARAKFDQQQQGFDRLREATLRAVTANDNLEKSLRAVGGVTDPLRAANDNIESLGRRVIEASLATVSFALHLRTVGGLAYRLSPQFRKMVDPLLLKLREANPELMKTADTLWKVTSTANLAGMALAKAGELFLRFVVPVYLAIKAVQTFVAGMRAISDLGVQRLEELTTLATRAGEAGTSTDYFQRQTQAAKELGVAVDSAIAAMKKFREVSTPSLGGSALQQRLDELVRFGNFRGNPGVDAYKQALTTEERYRAIVDLITVAYERGERLAAIDLAEKFAPADVVDRLRSNGYFLKEMLATADAVKPVDLITQKQIDYAIELKRRLEDAEAVLADKWKPLQRDLTQLGLNYRENWVSIVELMARAVGLMTQLYEWTTKEPAGWFAKIANGDWVKSLNKWMDDHGLTGPAWFAPPVTEIDPSAPKTPKSPLTRRFDPTAGSRFAQGTTDLFYALNFDLSKSKELKDLAKEAASEFDRLEKSLGRAAAAQEAEAKAVGLGAAAQAMLRAEMRLREAAAQDGKTIDEEYAARIKKIADRAGEAALALAKARVAANIDFDRKTMFLSPADADIARQLQGIYGNDVTAALGSAEAAALRFNDALKFGRDLSLDFALGFTRDLRQGIQNGEKFWDSFAKAGLNAIQRLIDKLMDVILQNLIFKAFGGLFSWAGGTPLPGGLPIGQGGIGHNAEGTDFWRGGLTWVGERGPELIQAPRGARIYPNAVSRAMMNGGQNDNSVRVSYAPVYNIAAGVGADGVRAVLDEYDRKNRAEESARFMRWMRDARDRRML